MGRSRASGMNTQVTLIIGVLYVAFTVFTIALVRGSMTRQAIDHAMIEVDDTRARYAAVDTYFADCIKPGVRALVGDSMTDDYYDPCWMSSRHAIREMEEERGASEGAEVCYYRQVCIDARVPENEADALEAEYILSVADNPNVAEFAEVRELDGEPFYVVMRVAQRYEQECMRCHSTPEVAPADLVEIYGTTAGFDRQVGDVAAVESVRVPLSDPLELVDVTSYGILASLGALLGLSLANAFVYNSRHIVRPLRDLNGQAEAVAVGEVPAGTKIQSAGPREVDDLADTISVMSDRVAGAIGALQVRTDELQAANEQLMSATAAKDEFLTNMSHDLRTPLNSVIGFSQIMLQGLAGPITEEQDKQLRMIKDAGDYLLALVNQILDLSRVENGDVNLTCSEIEVVELMRQQVELLRSTAEIGGLALLFECAFESLAMRGDDMMMRRIVANLIGNAIKFTTAGSVTVRLDASEDDVSVSVTDTGPGISAEELPRVFDAFWQHKVGEQAKPQGSGLGLAIARRLARAVGGDITASSVPGAGSTFTLCVPRDCSWVE